MFCATHTHSGPTAHDYISFTTSKDELDEEYIKDLIDNKMDKLIKEAMKNTFDAKIGIEIGYCGAQQGVGGNRRIKNGLQDPSVNVLAIKDNNDKFKACFYSYALHPTYLHAENTKVSADYCGYVRHFLSFAKPDMITDEGIIIVNKNKIIYVCNRKNIEVGKNVQDFGNNILGPGFVDIHCHAGGDVWAHESPKKMAQYHLKYGTTGILCTLYRDLGLEETLIALNKIKDDMKKCSSILGAHLEGPYINPNYGSGAGKTKLIIPKKQDYQKLIDTQVIRQWTVAPEITKTTTLIEDMVAAGVVPSLGHSEAEADEVFEAVNKGAKIVTHFLNATGCKKRNTIGTGILEFRFDHAVLLSDDLYYEIICDKNGIHLRKDMIKLILKYLDIDKLVAITDACTGGIDDGSDVNIVDGSIKGSKLTMLQVAKNLLDYNLTIPEIFRITSLNPSYAINMEEQMGSLEKGKLANIIVTDDKFSFVKVLKQ